MHTFIISYLAYISGAITLALLRIYTFRLKEKIALRKLKDLMDKDPKFRENMEKMGEKMKDIFSSKK